MKKVSCFQNLVFSKYSENCYLQCNFKIQVKDGFENVATELAKSKHALVWAQRKENESSSLIKDLTSMVKEQKAKLAEVSKLKQETAANLQVRHCTVVFPF